MPQSATKLPNVLEITIKRAPDLQDWRAELWYGGTEVKKLNQIV